MKDADRCAYFSIYIGSQAEVKRIKGWAAGSPLSLKIHNRYAAVLLKRYIIIEVAPSRWIHLLLHRELQRMFIQLLDSSSVFLLI